MQESCHDDMYFHTRLVLRQKALVKVRCTRYTISSFHSIKSVLILCNGT